MRVTDRMMVQGIVDQLQRNAQQLEKVQKRVASGRQVNIPSDDPQAAANILKFKEAITANEQYSRNAEAAISWMNATDDSLRSLGDLVQRAQVLAVQGANDTLGDQQRDAIAAEVQQLLEQALQVGNSSFAGRYLFAGTKTSTAPFTPVGTPPASVTYNGDTALVRWEVGPGQTIPVNMTGDQVFPAVFSALINLRDHLSADDPAAIRNADISALANAQDEVLRLQAEVGAKVNRLQLVRQQLEDTRLHLTELRSRLEDLDMAEGLTEMATREAAYRAALGTAARVLQPSLLDYLR